MKARLILLWHRLHSSYWFLPGLFLLAGIGAALWLTALDRDIDPELLSGASLLGVYTGGADGARAMLAAIASSVIAVAATTFSITVASLSLTSSQFGPRLLRNFMRDTGNQLVLGSFIGTFIYCLLVMRTVRSVQESSFVPHISVTVGVVLAVICAAMLVYFIHHTVTTIQAANFIAQAGTDVLEAIGRLFPEQIGAGEADADTAVFGRSARSVDLLARRSGYIEAYDGERLLALSHGCGATVELLREPGAFVGAGTALARVHGHVADVDAATRALDAACELGNEATVVQDATMPLNQLAEIAMRALSPGVNDPNTALMCVDRLAAGLCQLVARRFPSRLRVSEDGKASVVAAAPTFEDLVRLSFDPIRHYGAGDLRVLVRLLDALRDIASCGRHDARRRVLARIAAEVLEAGLRSLPSPGERRRLRERARAAQRAILGLSGNDESRPQPSPHSG